MALPLSSQKYPRTYAMLWPQTPRDHIWPFENHFDHNRRFWQKFAPLFPPETKFERSTPVLTALSSKALRSKFQFWRLRDLRSKNTTITNKKFIILEMNSRPIPISSAKWDSSTLAYFSRNKILLLSALSFHATLWTQKWGRSWAR